jgi:hypothetical protein
VADTPMDASRVGMQSHPPLTPTELLDLREGEMVFRLADGLICNVLARSRYHSALMYVECPDQGAFLVWTSTCHEWAPYGDVTIARLRPVPGEIRTGQKWLAPGSDGSKVEVWIREPLGLPEDPYCFWQVFNEEHLHGQYSALEIRADFVFVEEAPDPQVEPREIREGQVWDYQYRRDNRRRVIGKWDDQRKAWVIHLPCGKLQTYLTEDQIRRRYAFVSEPAPIPSAAEIITDVDAAVDRLVADVTSGEPEYPAVVFEIETPDGHRARVVYREPNGPNPVVEFSDEDDAVGNPAWQRRGLVDPNVARRIACAAMRRLARIDPESIAREVG